MKIDETIAMLKSRKQALIQEKKNPTFNLIVMSFKVSKKFLNNVRKKKELDDITCKHQWHSPGFEIKRNRSLPPNSVMYMQDLEPMAAWIEGKLKLITRKDEEAKRSEEIN